MNKITIFSLTLLFALILPLFANAQVTVKGIVTDESGVPLVGVSVRYKELPQVGVTTDIDGKFSIKEMKEGKTLVFSYIGMKNVEHLLKGATPFIKIKMESATSELDQVVVTGYTQTTFKKMTGSVGIISADQLKDQAQPTVDALMQGLPQKNKTWRAPLKRSKTRKQNKISPRKNYNVKKMNLQTVCMLLKPKWLN